MAGKPETTNPNPVRMQLIGNGSYGAVHIYGIGGQVCAGKTLHTLLCDQQDSGAIKYYEAFVKECDLLQSLSHKNIVKYFGVHPDPETNMPILLMELCKESLTTFLKICPSTLPYHIELNIGRDIALALVYLHSKRLIHRDLSSNNVLMVDDNRVKVSDFGMSKLVRVNPKGPLSLCPGSVFYMSPQALEDPPTYTGKLDVFSAGVLLLQIMTRRSPKPTQRLRVVPDSDNREMREIVPEIQRREADLNLIRESHPLKKIGIQCLEDNEVKRLSSKELEQSLKVLRQEDEYIESMEVIRKSLHAQVGELNEQLNSYPMKRQSKHPSSSKYDFKIKILLIGQCNVGKTCILRAYDGKEFQKVVPTIGVDTISKPFLYKGRSIQLCIWDSGGQERYHAIARNYFRHAQGALVVYDVTDDESFKVVPQWIKAIDNIEDEGIERILVGNKVDEDEKRKVSIDEGRQLAEKNGIHFIETSAKTNFNITEAFEILTCNIMEKQQQWGKKYNKDRTTVKLPERNCKSEQAESASSGCRYPCFYS